MKAGRCGSCEEASVGTEGSKDRGLTAVRPMVGAIGDEEESGNDEKGDREMAERIAGEEADKEEAWEEAQGEEAEESKGVNRGTKPSKKEVEEHERTHLPFRNWCKHCVFGKAKIHTGRRMKGKERNR